MNQDILFNDDYRYLAEQQCWCFTALMSGNLVTIYIATNTVQLSQDMKFYWEDMVEEFLQNDEPNSQNEIWLTL